MGRFDVCEGIDVEDPSVESKVIDGGRTGGLRGEAVRFFI